MRTKSQKTTTTKLQRYVLEIMFDIRKGGEIEKRHGAIILQKIDIIMFDRLRNFEATCSTFDSLKLLM